ncbi:sigma-54 interaction domain-containing protein [Papillibacter cinnamivorans]|uniref:HTH-type transcriptional regulatory protein TyrR n=1 Tax=Papillibacter cinnamivorans DSM 12816 TaxID=1122930 RepID=A0A1W2AIK3_9FIRM|nr:sigma 54-interacting transcriptional regulator [Papillibacter cinnamivorans]SMC60271.1 PAS domain S-box-containing protein [Papillibacter cinnamivorans DSM 12816]
MKREPVYLPNRENQSVIGDLGDARNRLTAILECSYDGIYITDGSARTIYINRSYEIISGLNRSEVMGKTMRELEESGVVSRSSTLLALARREAVTIEQEFKTRKRAIVTSTPLYNEDGSAVIVVTNVRDVSELRELKEQLAINSEMNRRYRSEIEVIRQQMIGSEDFIAEDPKMLELLRVVNRVAGLDTTVLLLGETGVGKELVATHIHKNSARSKAHFIKVNCGAITPSLVESELFGYEPGSFTGASRAGKMGLFEVADNGTIFLDEVAELPYDIQAKLLRVLQEQELLRVGGEKPVRVNVRLLAATNRNLEEMVSKKLFREDLYYRLNVFPVVIPPLRERQADIAALARHMLEQLNRKYGTEKSFTQTALAGLTEYKWPGNVRELRNVVERAFIMSGEGEITAADLPIQGVRIEPGTGILQDRDLNLKRLVEQVEKDCIDRAYRTYGNVRKAAKSLGMDPATFSRKRRKYSEKE